MQVEWSEQGGDAIPEPRKIVLEDGKKGRSTLTLSSDTDSKELKGRKKLRIQSRETR